MLRALPGRRVVVVGPDDVGPMAAIATALEAAGAAVHHADPAGWLGPDDVVGALHQALSVLSGLDQLIVSPVPASLVTATPFAEVAESAWVDACERPLDLAWWLVRAAIDPLRAAGGGSITFVVPTVGLSGASGLVMLSAVAEGLRLLAKGCGRCWGGDGVVANTVAASPALWVSSDEGRRLHREISLSEPALARSGRAANDLAPLVAALGADDVHFLTAGTVVADGGLWMGL